MLIHKTNLVSKVGMLLVAGMLAACGNKGANTPADAPVNEEEHAVDSATCETPSADSVGDYTEETQSENYTETQAKQHNSTPKQKAVKGETIFYDGRVGDDDVTVQLTFRDNQVSGFIVRESNNKKSSVSGTLDADGNIQLSEFSQSKKVGKLVGVKHRRKRRFSGDYIANGKTYTFKFSKSSAPDDGDDIYQ